jgi:hypothetical protein
VLEALGRAECLPGVIFLWFFDTELDDAVLGDVRETRDIVSKIWVEAGPGSPLTFT